MLSCALADSLAGEEGDPGEAQVVSVNKHVLDKQVWAAAMLLGTTQGEPSGNTDL